MTKRAALIRVGIFDQIVSGGGVRLFTTKLLEEFSRQAGRRWHFHLMWPLFDSSNNFLARPRLPHTSFERIESESVLRLRDKINVSLQRVVEQQCVRRLDRISRRVAKIRQDEQQTFRSGSGAGLRWLDQRMDNFDLLFMPYPYLTLPHGEKWRPSKPVVITLHDLAHEFTDAWGGATLPLRDEVRAWTRLANLIVFSSDFVQREAQRLYGLTSSRVRRIYLCPTAELRPAKNSAAVLGRHRLKGGYIFTIGWAAKHKRVNTIIEGFAQFRKKSNLNVSLVIAGPSTETLLNEKLSGLEVGKDLFALGYVRDEEIPALYQNAALVVTASISEAGLNSMIFDAMAYGKAVICSNIPPFVERLGTDDRLAIMFDPDSPQNLADALRKHFDDPKQAELRINKAREFVSARTLADVSSDYLVAFESLL